MGGGGASFTVIVPSKSTLGKLREYYSIDQSPLSREREAKSMKAQAERILRFLQLGFI
jgi:hypothetical protein